MSKRIALLQDGIVFNIVVGNSAEEMATLFSCQAIEVTEETQQAYIGYGFIDGLFEQAPYPVLEPTPTEESEKNF